MKNTLLLIFLFAASAYSQTTLDSFFVPGTSWIQLNSHFQPNPGEGYYYYYATKFRIYKDTLIAGRTFHLFDCKPNNGYFRRISVRRADSDAVFSADGPYRHLGKILVEGDVVSIFLDSIYVHPRGYPFEYIFDTGLLARYKYSAHAGTSVMWRPHYTYPSHPDSGVVTGTGTAQLVNARQIPMFHTTAGDVIYGVGANDYFVPYWNLLALTFPEYAFDIGVVCFDNPYFSYHRFSDTGAGRDKLLTLEANCFDISKVGVDDVSEVVSLDVFPNPTADDLISIRGNNMDRIQQIVIYDVTGRECSITEVSSQPHERTVHTSLQAGFYTVILTFSDHTVAVRKLVRL